jgi:hypothetical protein
MTAAAPPRSTNSISRYQIITSRTAPQAAAFHLRMIPVTEVRYPQNEYRAGTLKKIPSVARNPFYFES